MQKSSILAFWWCTDRNRNNSCLFFFCPLIWVFLPLSTELPTKWPVLHWLGHMGVAWNVGAAQIIPAWKSFFWVVIYSLFLLSCKISLHVNMSTCPLTFHLINLSYLFSPYITTPSARAWLPAGASPNRVQWVDHGTPSLRFHQTTSSFSEVSPQTERRWVSLRFVPEHQMITK